ncbi:CapA family protein [Egicoccus sp. AB-alg2]|uniref:CapA family protein n=1 Tax=Egicoccus sp. AB-alg2 TaxID=3242693 RepID=UPI00359EAB1D
MTASTPAGTVTLALLGDTMLGRGVGERLLVDGPHRLVDRGVRDRLQDADLRVLNLECCIAEAGQPWPDPNKAFFFRAPPAAVETLRWLGVDAVTLANNHALDYGHEALTETLDRLHGAGIATTGAGADVEAARAPARLEVEGVRVAVFGVTDHPASFAAGPARGGVAHAELQRGVPAWLRQAITAAAADVVVVTPHWGPNLTREPLGYVQRAADVLADAGATVVAGHSAHVFHGARLCEDPSRALLYDLGDFLDDYVTHPSLRNDLGLLWRVTVDAHGVREVDAVPLRLDFAATRVATGEDRAWIDDRLRRACAVFGTRVRDAGDRLVLRPAEHSGRLPPVAAQPPGGR